MIASTMICVKTKLSKAWSEVWPQLHIVLPDGVWCVPGRSWQAPC